MRSSLIPLLSIVVLLVLLQLVVDCMGGKELVHPDGNGHVVDTENIHGAIIALIKQYSDKIIARIKEVFPKDHEKKEKENINFFIGQIIKLIKASFPDHKKDKANISGMIIGLINEHFPGDKVKKESRSSITGQIIKMINENFGDSEKSHGSPGQSPIQSPGQSPGRSTGRLGHFVKGILGH